MPSNQIRSAEILRVIRAYVKRRRSWTTTTQAARVAGCSIHAARHALSRLLAAQIVVRVRGGSYMTPRAYELRALRVAEAVAYLRARDAEREFTIARRRAERAAELELLEAARNDPETRWREKMAGRGFARAAGHASAP